MPELDPLSPYRHLYELGREYRDLIDYMQETALDTEDIRRLNSERSVLHDQIWAECQRLGMPYDRERAGQEAIRISRWYRIDDEEYYD